MLKFLKQSDWILYTAVLLMSFFGLATIYGIALASENPDFSNFNKQLFFVGIGVFVMLFVSRLHYKFWDVYTRHFYLFAVILLISVLFAGEVVRGTRGWFQVFGLGIQPVEFAKFTVIIFLARFFSKKARDIDKVSNIVLSGICVWFLVFLVLLQPDFGSSLVMLGIWGITLLVIGVKRSHLLAMISFGVFLCVFAWNFFLVGYQQDRILAFLNPASDPLGRGYNITQAAIAVGSGEMFGRGLAFGSQSQLKFIPESQTDFIFAVLGEEFGFIGIVVVLGLWAIIFWRILVAAQYAKRDFGVFICLGIASLYLIHVMVNVGMNIGLMPVTGISLPFYSYGGSFLIMCFFYIGIIQSVVINK